MAKLRMMNYGCSLSFASGLSARDMSEAQKHNKHANRGWTKATTRNLTNYLMSLDFPSVDGAPYAFTLTIPATCMDRVSSAELHGLLAAWLRRCRRYYGMAHYYWLIEFTAQGTPHIHLTVWCHDTRQLYDRRTRQYVMVDLPPVTTQTLMLVEWIRLCETHDIPARMTGQLFRPVEDTPEAWLAYTAKHSTRGIEHYQRRLDNMPEDWQQHPRAMWGHDRNLTNMQADQWDLPMSTEAFWQFRRTIRRHLIQQARRIKDPRKRGKAISATRRMLKHGISPEEAHRKRWLDDNERFLPQSAFLGIRAWMSPQEQLAVCKEITGGPYADLYAPLVGRPTRIRK